MILLMFFYIFNVDVLACVLACVLQLKLKMRCVKDEGYNINTITIYNV